MNNGTSTVITDASNVFVTYGGADTSGGEPLLAKIKTQSNETVPKSLFWLVDETGDFCTNPTGIDNCFITLGFGYNDPPLSLVPYDLAANNGTLPKPFFSIDQATGVLTGHWTRNKPVTFTQNLNAFGNGDIDAYESGSALNDGYEPVSLVLLKSE